MTLTGKTAHHELRPVNKNWTITRLSSSNFISFITNKSHIESRASLCSKCAPFWSKGHWRSWLVVEYLYCDKKFKLLLTEEEFVHWLVKKGMLSYLRSMLSLVLIFPIWTPEIIIYTSYDCALRITTLKILVSHIFHGSGNFIGDHNSLNATKC